MALRNKSLFLYGYEITELNSSLDFKNTSGGSTLLATLNLGFYSLTALMIEIQRAMQVADPDNNYSITANRNVAGGLENRVTIATTTGTYLDLLFGSGPRVSSSIASLIGFQNSDQTGALTYTGTSTSGIRLIPTFVGYNYLSSTKHQQVFGNVNVSASGKKEAIIHAIQKFWQVQFKYEPESFVDSSWVPFLQWAIAQKLLEFTPDITNPNVFFEGTLEKTQADGKGLAYNIREQIPQFPGLFDIGLLTFRVNE
jgi:hypothetical protein